MRLNPEWKSKDARPSDVDIRIDPHVSGGGSSWPYAPLVTTIGGGEY